jgi:hypothetical protein
MPNWNINTLKVSDASSELIEYLKAEGLTFAKIAPVRPRDGVCVVTQQAYAWGTKWDLSEEESRDVANQLIDVGIASFDTAWTPPIFAIKALSVRFPDDKFTLSYYESGCQFWGIANFSAGNVDDECEEGTLEEASLFLQEEMGYNKEEADDYVGLTEI